MTKREHDAPASEGGMTEGDTRPDIFAVNVGNDGKVRIIDLCFTAFMRAKATEGNPDDNGPFDWFNDTYPMMVKAIEEMAEAIICSRWTRRLLFCLPPEFASHLSILGIIFYSRTTFPAHRAQNLRRLA